ncbi:MAG: hypothetical protein QNJ46_02530 [Leptolyngbyaceae cyanobacterium MO_188.B28]|nr:hypothetical protein [Leptolyngbyaceae cyanobacterium MO_188.B28]
MLKPRPRFRLVPVGAAIALILSGCGESKVTQCNRLAEVVNQTQGFMQEFETEIQSFSNSAAAVQNISDIKNAATQYTEAVNKVVTSLDGLASDLKTTELSDDSLLGFRDSYIGVVQGFSKALTQASKAMELVKTVDSEAALPARIEESQEKTMEAVSSIEELSITESNIIDNVNQYCGVNPQGSGE